MRSGVPGNLPAAGLCPRGKQEDGGRGGGGRGGEGREEEGRTEGRREGRKGGRYLEGVLVNNSSRPAQKLKLNTEIYQCMHQCVHLKFVLNL